MSREQVQKATESPAMAHFCHHLNIPNSKGSNIKGVQTISSHYIPILLRLFVKFSLLLYIFY